MIQDECSAYRNKFGKILTEFKSMWDDHLDSIVGVQQCNELKRRIVEK